MLISFFNTGFTHGFIIQMKIKIFFAFALVSLIINISACTGSNEYSETYIIATYGKILGKEIINEKTNFKGELVCLSDLEIDSPPSKETKKRIIRTKTVFQKGEQFPVSYSYNSSEGISYVMKVEDGQITRKLKGKAGTKEFTDSINQDISIVDIGSTHTLTYLIRKYDTKKGGRQVFKAYILPIASIEEISVTPGNINLSEHEEGIKNYKIEGKLIKALLWVDKENRLYSAFFPRSKQHVIRTDLFDKIKESILMGKKPEINEL